MGFVSNYLMNLPAVLTGRQPRRPLMFGFYITHACELDCTYCCDGDGRPFKEDRIDELDTDEIKRLISILVREADTLDITGGEPLLRKDLEDILIHCRSVGMRTVINTKGLGIAQRPDVLKYADTIVLSLDTLDLDRLGLMIGRTEHTAREIINAIAFSIKAAREHGTRIVLSCVATASNLDDIMEILDYAEKESVGFHISPEIKGKEVISRLRENPVYRELINAIIERKPRKRSVLGILKYFSGIRDFNTFRCYPLLMPTIRPDGKLYYPCIEIKKAEIDVLKAGSYSRALSAARKQASFPACKDRCHIFCHMGLSLLQRHPWEALREMKYWRNAT